MEKTYKYITTEKSALTARRLILQYLSQKSVVDGHEESPILAVDVETYFTDPVDAARRKLKVPRAIWLGDRWEGRVRTIQIGFDCIPDQYELKDRQFIFDVMRLGEKFMTALLKDILESAQIIGHNIKYDMTFLTAQFDIHPERALCTQIASQVYWAGDRIMHGLAYAYAEAFRAIPSKFEELTGMDFAAYKKFKKIQQTSRWDAPNLSRDQLKYAAEDVRLIFYLWDRQMDLCERFRRKYESHNKPGKGILAVMDMEFAGLPMFTKMEVDGIRFDKERMDTKVIPLLEKKMEEAQTKLCEWPEFRRYVPAPWAYTVVFCCDFDESFDIKERCKKAKWFFNRLFKGATDINNLSITTGKREEQKYVTVSWWNGPREEVGYDVLKTIFTPDKYRRVALHTINLNSRVPVMRAISNTIGQPVTSTKAKYLKHFVVPGDERTDCIKWYLRYVKAKDFATKFGRTWSKHVTPEGRIHVSWNPLGRETAETATGRVSANNPPIMQMPARDMLFAYSATPGGDTTGIDATELLRTNIIADEGCTFLDADYSQIEPRMAAQLTKDKALISVFRDGKDMHGMTAQAVLGLDYAPSKIKVDGIEKLMQVYLDGRIEPPGPQDKYFRDVIGKTTNLGVGYGMGAPAFAEYMYDKTNGEVVWSVKEAQEKLDRYFSLYSGVAEEMERVQDRVCRKLDAVGSLHNFKGRKPFGFSYDLMGRPRRYCLAPYQESLPDDVLDKHYNPTEFRFYYNEFKRRKNKVRLAAYNQTIQSSCSSLMKLAQIGIWKEFKKRYESGEFDPKLDKFILVLHDEILLSVQDKNIAAGKNIMEYHMVKAAKRFIKVVPVEIHVGQGKTWSSAK